MYTIRKIFKFEMAHVLDSSYSEECQSIHGHSYKMEVIIKSISLDGDGMVLDFKLLKEIVEEKITDKFDHRLVISSSNDLYCYSFPYNTIMVDYNPTAENMAKDFYNQLKEEIVSLVSGFISLEIILHETDTGYASYTQR